jgi:hypothetical protein
LRIVIEDGIESNVDEFQGAGSTNKPVNSFLRAQDSTRCNEKELSPTPSVREALNSGKHNNRVEELMDSDHGSGDAKDEKFGGANKQN